MRDTLEFKMIRYAMDHNIPLLCICRGIQILNVVNGGNLIPDIPTDYDTLVIHLGGTERHWLSLIEGTLLHDICQVAVVLFCRSFYPIFVLIGECIPEIIMNHLLSVSEYMVQQK